MLEAEIFWLESPLTVASASYPYHTPTFTPAQSFSSPARMLSVPVAQPNENVATSIRGSSDSNPVIRWSGWPQRATLGRLRTAGRSEGKNPCRVQNVFQTRRNQRTVAALV